MPFRRALGIFALFALFGIAPGVHALQAQGTLIPIRNRTYIGGDPLGIPFDIASLELESAVAAGTTLGGAASYTSLGDDRYVTFDVKVRYYPGEVVLRGFAVGLSVGSLHYSTIPSPDTLRASLDAPTVGVLTDYNWMLGPDHRFLVGTGVEAKRIIAGKDQRARVDLGRAYLTARFVIGIAF